MSEKWIYFWFGFAVANGFVLASAVITALLAKRHYSKREPITMPETTRELL